MRRRLRQYVTVREKQQDAGDELENVVYCDVDLRLLGSDRSVVYV
jgi:hypothetical protein